MVPVSILVDEEKRFRCPRCNGYMLLFDRTWRHLRGKPKCPDTYEGLLGLFGFSEAPVEG